MLAASGHQNFEISFWGHNSTHNMSLQSQIFPFIQLHLSESYCSRFWSIFTSVMKLFTSPLQPLPEGTLIFRSSYSWLFLHIFSLLLNSKFQIQNTYIFHLCIPQNAQHFAHEFTSLNQILKISLQILNFDHSYIFVTKSNFSLSSLNLNVGQAQRISIQTYFCIEMFQH